MVRLTTRIACIALAASVLALAAEPLCAASMMPAAPCDEHGANVTVACCCDVAPPSATLPTSVRTAPPQAASVVMPSLLPAAPRFEKVMMAESRVRHRPGRPISLSILHSSFLL